MVGPNRWRDEGPANGTRGLAIGGAPAIGGRAIGYMQADRAVGPALEARSDGTAKLGIAPRHRRRWNGAPLEP